MTVLEEEAPANYVPAAAVTRRGPALSGITGRKAHAGGLESGGCNTGAQLRHRLPNYQTGARERAVEFPV